MNEEAADANNVYFIFLNNHLYENTSLKLVFFIRVSIIMVFYVSRAMREIFCPEGTMTNWPMAKSEVRASFLPDGKNCTFGPLTPFPVGGGWGQNR